MLSLTVQNLSVADGSWMNLHRHALNRVSTLVSRPASAGLLATLIGMSTILGYAPFGWFPIPVVALACLIGITVKQASAQRAAYIGFCFGIGMFGAGVSWVYISLNTYGGMSATMAFLSTVLFCVYLAVFPTLFAFCCWLVRRDTLAYLMLTVPAFWTATELARGTFFTGFPWLSVGYSQIVDSPLSGYAPIFGVYGVSLAVAVSSGLLFHCCSSSNVRRYRAAIILVAIIGVGVLLKQVSWTSPSGLKFSVALLQGNVPQDTKWKEASLKPTLDLYLSLVRQSSAKLIVLPETAIPLFIDEIPNSYVDALMEHIRARDSDLITGILERQPSGEGDIYYNSAISMGVSQERIYRKQHLVPFGEYVPSFRLVSWVVDTLRIPLNNMSRGPALQEPIPVAGEMVAINICFEDVFGEEIRQALPSATVLVNLSNLAWFGDSLAAPQHLQISKTRALEVGRYMLRSTNTGATAIIDPRGTVVRQAQPFERLVLEGDAQGFTGATPYVILGNVPILLFCGLGLLVGLSSRRGWATEKKGKLGAAQRDYVASVGSRSL